MEENLRQVNSKDLKEMYEKNKDMQKFLDKEYKRLRGNDE